ncbi:MAG: PAS domain-containing protein [Chloroflexota bacterium]|nr:PAS domain-containing protein [Chloroflexota bacterium]
MARWNGYLLAAASTVFALLLAMLVKPFVNDVQIGLFFVAVMVSSWLRGLGSGIAAAGLATLALSFVLPLPVGTPSPQLAMALELAIFALTGLLITVLNVRLRQNLGAIRRPSQRLEELARQGAAILQQMPSGIYVVDAQGYPIFINEAARAIGGRFPTSAKPVPQQAADFALRKPGGAPLLPAETPIARALAGEKVTRFEYFLRRDHSDVWVEASASPIRDGDGHVAGAVAVFTDVTRERRLAHELTASEERFHFLADVGQALAVSLDYETTVGNIARLPIPKLADWVVVDLMEGRRRTRRTAAHGDDCQNDLVQRLKSTAPIDVAPPAPGNRHSAPEGGLARALLTGQAGLYEQIDPASLAASLGDGGLEPVVRELGAYSAMFLPLMARGKVAGAITLVRATPGSPYGRADLKLAREMAMRAGLALSNARLLLSDQHNISARQDFLAAAAHDLRSPLTVINLRAHLLRRRLQLCPPLEDPTLAALTGGLDEIIGAIRTMSATIDELMDAVQLQLGQPLTLHCEPTDIVSVARRVAAIYQPTTQQHRIVVRRAPDSLVGYWDLNRIERVVDNLVNNAIKYSPNGGEVVIDISSEGTGAELRAVLSVQDPGIGIPAGDLPFIFERFHRGKNVATSIPGVGMGLAGARGAVEQHGGTLTVESHEHQGSRFTVRLPLAAGSDLRRDLVDAEGGPGPSTDRRELNVSRR